MARYTNRQVDRQGYRQIERQKDRWMDGKMKRWMERYRQIQTQIGENIDIDRNRKNQIDKDIGK